jgi:splicing factor 3A subunit 1
LTAQFVAKNGMKFMIKLGQREQSNFQFEFLRPSNSLYPFFMRLVDQYSKVLTQSTQLLDRLEANVIDRYQVITGLIQIIERISKRLEFEAFALDEEEKQKKSEENDKRRN